MFPAYEMSLLADFLKLNDDFTTVNNGNFKILVETMGFANPYQRNGGYRNRYYYEEKLHAVFKRMKERLTKMGQEITGTTIGEMIYDVYVDPMGYRRLARVNGKL
jgi:hypothetical protein